jgi:hypothetical protein
MALIVRTILICLGCAALAPTIIVKCTVSSIKLLLDRGASKSHTLVLLQAKAGPSVNANDN